MTDTTRKGLVRRVVDWVGSHEPVVLVTVGVIVAATWAFIGLADEVNEGETDRIDLAVVKAFRDTNPEQPLGPHWLPEAVRDVTALGGVTVLALVTFSSVGFLWLDGKRAAALWVLLAVVGGTVVSFSLKDHFGRERPPEELRLVDVSSSSFPSGHSMMSAVTYLTLGAMCARVVERRRLKFYVLALAFLLTFAVGFSRVYLGVHYPTDVLAGWTAGLAWALFSRLLMSRWLVSHPEAAKSDG